MLVTISHLSKSYDSTRAIDNLSLQLESGRIVGLLGPNGSGKTTLIKVLLGLLRQYDGSVQILGKSISDESKAYISYLPDKNHIPLHWNFEYACKFFADFFVDFDMGKAQSLCAQLGLNPKQKLKHLSKGNREKIALILMLSRKAKLYIFDEPIAGVDPVARDLVFKLILENYDKNASVLIATHLIHDVEPILDEAIFLSHGQVLAHKTIEEFTAGGLTLEGAFKQAFAHNFDPQHTSPQHLGRENLRALDSGAPNASTDTPESNLISLDSTSLESNEAKSTSPNSARSTPTTQNSQWSSL